MKTFNMKYIFSFLMMFACISLSAQETVDKWEKWGPTNKERNAGIIVRVGYTIGGTMPVPIPAEIRSINEFSPRGGGMIGFEAYWMLNKRWGIVAGLHLSQQGFHTSADVKGYEMTTTGEDGESLHGFVTGTDVTNMESWGVTIPVLATFRISPRWNVSLGPYITTYFATKFNGEAYGYMRLENPLGQKLELGKGTNHYEFGDKMRSFGAGVELQFDWKATKHLNVFGQLDWGLMNALDPNANEVSFPMYPVYGTIGVAYRY